MRKGWYQAYLKLRKFMMERHEIEITHRVIAIPQNIRAEFYRLFNHVRTAFIKEQLPNLPKETKRLREYYVKAEEDVKKLLGLEEVSIATDLYKFLNDANGRLTQDLFDLLFNLLIQQIDAETFEIEGARGLRNSYRELYQQAYQKWIALSLVKLLKASKNFSVVVPSLEMTPRGPRIVVDSKPVAKPQESRRLTFLHDTTPVFIAPDFIIYSSRMRRFVAFRTEIGSLDTTAEVMWKASEISAERQWHSLKELGPLWRKYDTLDLRFDLIVYIHDRVEDIALIADAEKFCRPDLVLVCIGQNDLLEKALEKGKLYKRFLNPKYGTSIVCRNPSGRFVKDKLEEGTYLLPIGFNQAKLNAVLNILGS